MADTVFPALHGGIGENGHLAALLDILGISYAGSSAKALAVTMNKADTKIYYENASILTPSYTVYKKEMKKTPCPPRYPCVVKPATAGSSIGVCFVCSENELCGAVENALKESDTVIIEERIYGRELSVSVLENKAIAVTEIIPGGAYYDYDSKYLYGGSREITPAPIPLNITLKALKIAENAHNALGLSGFSRTDLIMQKGTGRLYALETNALPGMTETSILPTAARSVGIEMSELVCRMLRK
jgi:D-alanine-D-alanine ligase